MMIREFLEHLEAADVHVWAEGDTLRCNAPKGTLSPEMQSELKARKAEVLAFLRAAAAPNRSLVPIQPKGSRVPFFGVPGHNGDVFCYVPLAQRLGDDQPFYGLQPPGFNGECAPLDDVRKLAARYVREMTEFLPGGPYCIGGFCAGGSVAFEVAQQLVQRGEEVPFLAFFECPFPTFYLKSRQIPTACRYVINRIPHHVRAFMELDSAAKGRYIREKFGLIKRIFVKPAQVPAAAPAASPEPEVHHQNEEIAAAAMRAVKAYRPTVLPGRIHIFMSSEESRRHDYTHVRKWIKYAGLGHKLYVGPDGCVGSNMLREPHVEVFERLLSESLGQVRVFERAADGRNP